MVSIIIYLIMISIYCVSPLPLQFIMLIINTLVPDPIPILDELIMYIGFINKLSSLENILDFIVDHKIISFIIGIIVLVIIFNLIC